MNGTPFMYVQTHIHSHSLSTSVEHIQEGICLLFRPQHNGYIKIMIWNIFIFWCSPFLNWNEMNTASPALMPFRSSAHHLINSSLSRLRIGWDDGDRSKLQYFAERRRYAEKRQSYTELRLIKLFKTIYLIDWHFLIFCCM